MATKYEHNGTEITFDETRGDFLARIGTKNIRKVSLAAMKKAIDTTAISTFKPFYAWEEPGLGRSAKLTKVRIIDVEQSEKKRKYRDAVWVFVTDGGRRVHPHHLYVDSPESLAAVNAYEAYSKETERIAFERREQAEKLRAAIQHPKLPTEAQP